VDAGRCVNVNLCLGGRGGGAARAIFAAFRARFRVRGLATVWATATARVAVDLGAWLWLRGCGYYSSVVVSDTKGISAVVVTVWVATESANGSIWVPRWVDAMDAVVLLSRFLVLGLHGEDDSGQSQQKQNNLNICQKPQK
jgi:hypothetical protein